MPSLSNWTILPSRGEIAQAVSSFSIKNKLLLLGLLVILLFSLGAIIWRLDDRLLVTVAKRSGSLSEGLVGSPAFVNPLLVSTDADRDLVALIYSGLTRVAPDGRIIPDLAESWTVSPDGLTYDFKLKSNLKWSDGQPLTIEDIVFTVAKAQDPLLKSSKRTNWEGVTVVKKNEVEISFILKQPYAGFLQNTTLGLLPAHLWQNIGSEAFYLSKYNLEAIGSGPYQVAEIKKDSVGIPIAYDLRPFSGFALGQPNIAFLHLAFYPNEDELKKAYDRGEIESLGALSPATADKLKKEGANLSEVSLPRIFAVFFNQSQIDIFTDSAVRRALNLAIDRKAIIEQVLNGYGEPTTNALPPGVIGYLDQGNAIVGSDPDQARAILARAGWKAGVDGILTKTVKKKTSRLAFAISTGDTSELKAVANLLKGQWRKIGADVQVRIFELGDLNQNVIKPRKFDALLFGEVVGRDPDLYSFWHSSQRNYPGLNVAQYANKTTDQLLSQARGLYDPDQRAELYRQFQTALAKDMPAVFIYSPRYLYVLPAKIKGEHFISFNTPTDRFFDIYKWYIDSERVWKIFAN